MYICIIIPIHCTPLHSTAHTTLLHSTALHSNPLHFTLLLTPLHSDFTSTSTSLDATPLKSTLHHPLNFNYTSTHFTPLHSYVCYICCNLSFENMFTVKHFMFIIIMLIKFGGNKDSINVRF